MGLFKRSQSEIEAEQRLRDARTELEANAIKDRKAGVDWETPTYHRLNQAVLDAEADVSWWRGGTKKRRR